LSQEKLEKEHEKQLQALREDNVSLNNVVHSLRTQLKHNSDDKKESVEFVELKEELEKLRETHQRANQELGALRSKHAILREENCSLYAKVEDLESCEEVLRQVQSRAKMLEAECVALQAEKAAAENEAEALYSRWRAADSEALRFKRLYLRAQINRTDAIPEEVRKWFYVNSWRNFDHRWLSFNH